jgi:hypothetical protein
MGTEATDPQHFALCRAAETLAADRSQGRVPCVLHVAARHRSSYRLGVNVRPCIAPGCMRAG